MVDENNRIVVTNERYRQIYLSRRPLHPGHQHQNRMARRAALSPIQALAPLPDGPAGEALVAAR